MGTDNCSKGTYFIKVDLTPKLEAQITAIWWMNCHLLVGTFDIKRDTWNFAGRSPKRVDRTTSRAVGNAAFSGILLWRLTPQTVLSSTSLEGRLSLRANPSLPKANPWPKWIWASGGAPLWESKFYVPFQPQKRAWNKSNILICRPELTFIRLKNTSVYTVYI